VGGFDFLLFDVFGVFGLGLGEVVMEDVVVW